MKLHEHTEKAHGGFEEAQLTWACYCHATDCRTTCNSWYKLKHHVREDHIQKLLDPGDPRRSGQAVENNTIRGGHEKTPLEMQLLRFQKDTGKRACHYDGCGYTCTAKPVLNKHVTSRHGGQLKDQHIILICSECGFNDLRTANDLRDHRVTEHLWKLDIQPPFTCSHSSCGQRFGSRVEQKDHMSSVHGVLSYHCCDRPTRTGKTSPCTLRFKTKEALEAHIHSYPSYCQSQGCGKGFGSKAERDAHIESSHGGRANWACHCRFGNCEDYFRNWGQLREHVRKTHIPQLQAAHKSSDKDQPIVLLDESDAEAAVDELTNEFNDLSSGEDPGRAKKTSQPSAQAAIAGPSTSPRKKSVSGRQPVSRDSSPDARPGERLRKHPAGSSTNVRKALSGQQKFYTETSESERPGPSGSSKGKQTKKTGPPKLPAPLDELPPVLSDSDRERVYKTPGLKKRPPPRKD
jgi:hypothetical protein